MSDIAIKVENLGKKYKIGTSSVRYQTFRESIINNAHTTFNQLIRKQPKQEKTIWALKDINFEIKHGEVMGIIGRNGAGKSTLLKILSQITKPTTGRIVLNGRVGSLLEVGTGFHPELTGRENIYLNGAILGMNHREITRKFDEIVEFAEIGKFLDTSVKHYSSGMYMRLAFAVAAHLDPEILVIDEVLAVGDAYFQKKCLGKMENVAHEGRTVLFVSHQMDMIRSLCHRCILLVNGTVQKIDATEIVVDKYIHYESYQEQKSKFRLSKQEDIFLQVISGKIFDEEGNEKETFDVFEKIFLELDYVLTKPIEGAVVNFELKRNGTTLFLSFDTDNNVKLLEKRTPGLYRTKIQIPSPLLKPGNYTFSINTGIINIETFQHLEDILSFIVELRSKPSSLLAYAEKRKGIIAVPIDWNTKKIQGNIYEQL
jgi:lipopolysaccharide transport system ATP-binding protein